MKPETDRPITIEDLLRLKRAERPPAEFWATFDQELRAKQLAALVGKRPWWQTLPQMFSRLSRYRVPLGATAVVAVTFFSVRDDRSVTPVQAAMQPEVVASEVVSEVAPIAEEAIPVVAAAEVSSVSGPVAVQEAEPAVAVVAETSSAGELPRVLPLGGSLALDTDAEPQSPSARRIAESLAAVQALDPIASRSLLEGTNGFEVRVMPVRVAVEPLQQMTPPSDTRRSRLLTAMVSKASMDSSMRTTARAASRIDEERLYDQIHRFGARADRVHVKF